MIFWDEMVKRGRLDGMIRYFVLGTATTAIDKERPQAMGSFSLRFFGVRP
jgi:hypothetical protein